MVTALGNIFRHSNSAPKKNERTDALLSEYPRHVYQNKVTHFPLGCLVCVLWNETTLSLLDCLVSTQRPLWLCDWLLGSDAPVGAILIVLRSRITVCAMDHQAKFVFQFSFFFFKPAILGGSSSA